MSHPTSPAAAAKAGPTATAASHIFTPRGATTAPAILTTANLDNMAGTQAAHPLPAKPSHDPTTTPTATTAHAGTQTTPTSTGTASAQTQAGPTTGRLAIPANLHHFARDIPYLAERGAIPLPPTQEAIHSAQKLVNVVAASTDRAAWAVAYAWWNKLAESWRSAYYPSWYGNSGAYTGSGYNMNGTGNGFGAWGYAGYGYAAQAYTPGMGYAPASTGWYLGQSSRSQHHDYGNGNIAPAAHTSGHHTNGEAQDASTSGTYSSEADTKPTAAHAAQATQAQAASLAHHAATLSKWRNVAVDFARPVSTSASVGSHPTLTRPASSPTSFTNPWAPDVAVCSFGDRLSDGLTHAHTPDSAAATSEGYDGVGYESGDRDEVEWNNNLAPEGEHDEYYDEDEDEDEYQDQDDEDEDAEGQYEDEEGQDHRQVDSDAEAAAWAEEARSLLPLNEMRDFEVSIPQTSIFANASAYASPAVSSSPAVPSTNPSSLAPTSAQPSTGGRTFPGLPDLAGTISTLTANLASTNAALTTLASAGTLPSVASPSGSLSLEDPLSQDKDQASSTASEDIIAGLEGEVADLASELADTTDLVDELRDELATTQAALDALTLSTAARNANARRQHLGQTLLPVINDRGEPGFATLRPITSRSAIADMTDSEVAEWVVYYNSFCPMGNREAIERALCACIGVDYAVYALPYAPYVPRDSEAEGAQDTKDPTPAGSTIVETEVKASEMEKVAKEEAKGEDVRQVTEEKTEVEDNVEEDEVEEDEEDVEEDEEKDGSSGIEQQTGNDNDKEYDDPTGVVTPNAWNTLYGAQWEALNAAANKVPTLFEFDLACSPSGISNRKRPRCDSALETALEAALDHPSHAAEAEDEWVEVY